MSLPVFKGIEMEMLTFIAECGVEKHYPVGKIIFQQGDICDHFAILLDGEISFSFFSEQGKEVVVSEAAPGSVIGGAEIVLGCAWMANASTTKDSTALAFGRPALTKLLTHAPFAKVLMTSLGLMVRETMAFAENLAIHPLETRLARFLIAMSETHGRPVGDGIQIDRILPQGRIGQMINASRPKINAQLRAWHSRNVIRLSDSRIVILDQPALRSLSRQDG